VCGFPEQSKELKFQSPKLLSQKVELSMLVLRFVYLCVGFDCIPDKKGELLWEKKLHALGR
jgi:hypothetical protein